MTSMQSNMITVRNKVGNMEIRTNVKVQEANEEIGNKRLSAYNCLRYILISPSVGYKIIYSLTKS